MIVMDKFSSFPTLYMDLRSPPNPEEEEEEEEVFSYARERSEISPEIKRSCCALQVALWSRCGRVGNVQST
jgi:hypothetical protein